LTGTGGKIKPSAWPGHCALSIEHPGNASKVKMNSNLTGTDPFRGRTGGQKTVEILLPAQSLAYWNMAKHAFEVEPDKIQIKAGDSSADIRLQKSIDVN